MAPRSDSRSNLMVTALSASTWRTLTAPVSPTSPAASPSGAAWDGTSLQMNDTGTRLFFRDYPTGDIYYLDTASPDNSQVALLGAAWVDARKPYTLDALGNTLYLKHQVVVGRSLARGALFLPRGWHSGHGL